jgi:hypothetical protein
LKKPAKGPAKNLRIRLGSACLCSDFTTFGVIQTNEDHFLIVKENKLTACLAQIAWSGWVNEWGSFFSKIVQY